MDENTTGLRRRLVADALHALALAPKAAFSIVELDGLLHLVDEREPDDEAMGERLTFACGQRRWSDIELPLLSPWRGGWQAAHEHGHRRCAGCEPHASRFPEARERVGDPGMPGQVAAEVHQRVDERAAATGRVWEEALVEELASRAHAAGLELLPHLLPRQSDKLLAEHGADRVAALLDDAAWQQVAAAVVAAAVEDEFPNAGSMAVFYELSDLLAQLLWPRSAA